MRTKKLIYYLTLLLFLTYISSIYSQSTPDNGDKMISNHSFKRLNNSIVPGNDGINTIHIKIVESESYNVYHVMDTIWRNVALSRGQAASIVPQSIYNDTSFFDNTDVLIISSGVITLPSNAENVIKRFVMRKKNVYIQSEYLSSYSTNQVFQTLVNDLGGSFAWGATVNGNLAPMQVVGSLSQYPNVVTSFNYFWYGVYGSGNNTIENYLMYMGYYYGFIFTPPNPNYGIIITNSDQDWVRTDTCEPLLENIIYKLTNGITGVRNLETNIPNSYSLSQNFPNPFNPVTKIRFSLPAEHNSNSAAVQLVVFDMLGREMTTLVNQKMQPGNYEVTFDGNSFSSGVYYYKLSAGTFTDTKKFVLLK